MKTVRNRNVTLWSASVAIAFSYGLLHFNRPIELKRMDSVSDEFSDSKRDDNYDALLESVIAILDTYYVDENRIAPAKIFEHTLRELEFQHVAFEATITNQNVTVRIDGDATDFGLLPETEDQLRSKSRKLIELVNKKINKFKTKDDKNDAETIVVNALVSSLDAHSSLMNAATYRDLRQGTEGSFGGLGILVGTRGHILSVVKPLPNSPALRSGIKEYDKILTISGVDTFGIPLDKLVEFMRGEPGTSVDLVLLRDKESAPRKIKLTREIIQVDSVVSKRIPFQNGSLLHLSIDSFSSRTSKEALDAIIDAKRKGPLAGLILDLRSNPGGLLDQAVQLSDLFLKSGVIVSTKGRKEEVERAGRGYDELDYPIVILTNEESASASEIVAGALQDHKRAIVIGQRTFGKGSVQTVFELPYAQALKLTIARYYTPLNRSIQNRGIIPDIATQPIFKQDQNLNLFGKSHYFNEFSLSHHLETEENPFEGTSTFKKIFYMKNDEKRGQRNHLEDIELKLAKLVISKVHNQYGWNLPESARRSSHWLALTSGDVEKFSKAEEAKLKTWLQSIHKVEWERENDIPHDLLSFDLNSENESSLESVPGSNKSISWKFTNKSKKPLNRASVQLKSNDFQIETQEKLLGTVKANQSIDGTFDLQIPRSIRAGKYDISLALAVNGETITESQRKFKLIIKDKNFAAVQISARIDDSSSGRIQNVLEPNEKCNMGIKVTNTSNTALQKGKIRILNFTGNQITLSSTEIPLNRIEPGQTIQLEVPLAAASRLESNRHQIGIILESEDIADDSFALAVIGEGNTDIPSQSLAH